MEKGNTKKIINYIKENKWIISSFLFFIVFKFFLISTLWHDRSLPPTPDDSYIYIQHIDSVLSCKSLIFCEDNSTVNFTTYAGFDHLTYRLFFGIIGKLFHFDSLETYHASFYIGTVLLAFSLLFFLKRLNNDQKLIAFSFFILALYNGSGAYHGFFWVVPSFFSLIFVLIILGILLDDAFKNWKVSLGIIAPFYVFTHVLSLYFLSIFIFLFLFLSFLTKKFNKLIFHKIIFLSVIAILLYTPVAIYYSNNSYGNPYGPEAIIKDILAKKTTIIEKSPIQKDTSLLEDALQESKKNTETNPIPKVHTLLLPGLEKINASYFKWIFPNWLGYPLFLLCLGILFYFKKFKLLSLYAAGFTLVLLSSLNTNSERALVFLWPITFLVYGQASWFGFQLISKKISSKFYAYILKFFLILFVTFFIFLSATYAYLWNNYVNQVQNITTSDEVIEYLILNTSPQEKVIYSKDITFLDIKMDLLHKSNKPERVGSLSKAKFYITTEKNPTLCNIISHKSTFKKFFDFLSKTMIFTEKSNDNESCVIQPIPLDAPLKKEKQFGEIGIYRINK